MEQRMSLSLELQNNQNYEFQIPDDEGKANFQPVTVGITQAGRTQIVQGLEAGDQIFLELPPEQQRSGRSGFPLP